MRPTLAVLVPVFISVMVNPASAGAVFEFADSTEATWMMTAAALVLFMQGGFMLLEAGTVRAKNSVNVAQKNLIDLLVSVTCFGFVGFALMFGASQNGLFGWSESIAFFDAEGNSVVAFMVFQAMFCGTAATIVSGAVAERMSMGGYIWCTVIIALLIYPVSGHWVWGGLLYASDAPILAARGFMDFAGGTVVHSVGAWVALAAVILLGPRKGKFDQNGKPVKLHGYSPILATVGMVVIFVGWIGFNGGSTSPNSPVFGPVVRTTIFGAVLGGFAAVLLGRILSGVYTPAAGINGVLGGLVAITAGADVFTGSGAALVGSIGGLIALFGEKFNENILKIDDPIGAISVHGYAGAFGTIAIAFFAPKDTLLAGTRLDQFYVQGFGVLIIALWAFGVAFTLLWVGSKFFGGSPNGLRVPTDHEEKGLNYTEHDAPLGTGRLEEALFNMARGDGSSEMVEVERGDEAYEMSLLINEILKDNQITVRAIEDLVAEARLGQFERQIDTSSMSPSARRICSSVNEMNEAIKSSLQSIEDRVVLLADGDLVSEVKGQMKGSFATIQSSLHKACHDLCGLMKNASSSAARVSDVATEIVAASGNLSKSAVEQNEVANRANTTVNDLDTTAVTLEKAANQTSVNCLTAKQAAHASFCSVSDVVAVMESIQNGMRDITSAMKDITGIASQTRMLSINASVEAARHSNEGEGFNVVANEVRNLADKAAHTVQGMDAIIASLNNAVERGRHQVAELNSQLEEINETVSESADLATRSTELVAEQTKQLQTVRNLVGIVASNSTSALAMVSKSETGASNLVQQAESTRSLLRHFKLTDITVERDKAA